MHTFAIKVYRLYIYCAWKEFIMVMYKVAEDMLSLN